MATMRIIYYIVLIVEYPTASQEQGFVSFSADNLIIWVPLGLFQYIVLKNIKRAFDQIEKFFHSFI